MAAPKGNTNAVGNPGGGRKSAFQEKADAAFLANFFFEQHTDDEIREMIKGGRSVAKQMLAKAIGGNEKYTLAVFNKLFPDLSKSEMKVEGEIKTSLVPEVLKIAEAELKKRKTNDQ